MVCCAFFRRRCLYLVIGKTFFVLYGLLSCLQGTWHSLLVDFPQQLYGNVGCSEVSASFIHSCTSFSHIANRIRNSDSSFVFHDPSWTTPFRSLPL